MNSFFSFLRSIVVHHAGRTLTIRYDSIRDRIAFDGGYYGAHSLDRLTSSPQRLAAHWAGYLEQNGADPKTTVGGMYLDGENIVFVTRRNKWGALFGFLYLADGTTTAELELRAELKAAKGSNGGKLPSYSHDGVCSGCGEPIEWHMILTRPAGSGAHVYGSCECGSSVWHQEERGGRWGNACFIGSEGGQS